MSEPTARERIARNDLHAGIEKLLQAYGVDVVRSVEISYPLMDLVEAWAGERVRRVERERDRLRDHILDIDAHATPYGDLPDDPGYVGVYLLTAGALHRALGTIGHTAPSCQAEALLRRMTDAVCVLDSDGSCITHHASDPCPHGQARALLAELDQLEQA